MFLEGGWEDSLMPILAQVVKLDFKSTPTHFILVQEAVGGQLCHVQMD